MRWFLRQASPGQMGAGAGVVAAVARVEARRRAENPNPRGRMRERTGGDAVEEARADCGTEFIFWSKRGRGCVCQC